MIGIFCLAASTLFLSGLVLGLVFNPLNRKTRGKKSVKTQGSSLDELSEDFRNFLSYDGSEQS